MQDAIAADKTGDGFIFNMFLYELENYEFGYSRSISDVLEALGYTYDQIKIVLHGKLLYNFIK
jgi:hypothetical protein